MWWTIPKKRLTRLLVMALAIIAPVLVSLPVNSAQSIPYTINFQGRLTDNSGNALADGSYNIKFRIYNAATSGTLQWEEDRVMGATDKRITVTNGLFNIQFGEIAAAFGSLSPSLFNSASQLYLEVELPTPATATCGTNGCASFTEGAMTPRQALASSAYAFNADAVDGIDGSSIVQLSPGGPQTGTINVSGNITSAAQLQGSTAALSGASALTLGSTTNAGSIIFNDGTVNARNVSISATGVTASYGLVLPTSTPGINQCLSGGPSTATNLTWVNCTTGTYLNKNAADSSSSSSISASSYLYSFGNNSSNASGVLSLNNNANTASALYVTGTGDAASNNAYIYVYKNSNSTTGNLLDLQAGTSSASKFAVSSAGNITAAGTYNTNTFNGNTLTFGTAGTATVSSAGSQALTITANAASTWSTSSGLLTIQGLGGATIKSTDSTTLSTSAVTIKSGDATVGSNLSSGAISIDSGSKTGLGTTGGISIGTTNASGITLGKSGLSVSTPGGLNAGTAAIQGGTAALTGASALTLGSTTNAGSIIFNDGTVNARNVSISATGVTATYGLVLPTSTPGINQCLAGGPSTATNLTWVACQTGTYLNKNAADSSTSSSISASSYLYSFSNNSSNASGVLSLNNNANTASALYVTGTGDAASNNAYIYVYKNSNSTTGNLLDLQAGTSSASKFAVSSAGNVTAAGTYNTNTFNGNTLTFGSASAATIASAASQILNVNGTNGLALQAVAGNASLDGATASNITIGASVTGGNIVIGSTGAHTGNIDIGTGTGIQALNFGTGGTGAKTVIVGSTASSSSLTLQGGTGIVAIQNQGTGAINIATNGVASTINIGKTGATAFTTAVNVGVSTGAAQTILIGGTGTSGSTSHAGSTTTIQGGATILSVADTAATVKTFTNSGTALQVLNSIGSAALVADTTPLNTLITNGSAENATIAEWASKQNATVTRDTAQKYIGSAAIKTVLGGTTAIGDGVKYTPNPVLAATTYTLSFSIMQTAGTAFGTNLAVGWNNGSDTNCTLSPSLTTQPVPTTGWARYSCTFTGSTGGAHHLYWKQLDAAASARTFFIDAVQVETGSSATPFKESGLSLNGVINSPTTFRNQSDSTTALQIQTAASTPDTLFKADTLNNRVYIGNQTAAAAGDTTQLIVDSVPNGVTTPTGVTGGLIYDLNSGSVGLKYYDGSTWKTVCNTTSCTGGADTLATAYSNGTAQASSTMTLDSTRLGVIIQDASSPISGNLLTIKANGVSGATFLGVSTTAITMQDSSGNNAFVFDSANSILKVYENATSPTNFASISATNTTATFMSNSGTTIVGSDTGAVTIDAGSGAAVNITGHAASTWQTDAGGILIQGGTTLSLVGGTTVSVTSTTSSSATFDSGTTGAVNIANNSNAKAITLGNATAGTTLNVESGTAANAIQIGNGTTAHGIQIGSSASATQTIVLGSTSASSTTTIEGGTGASSILIGNGTSAHGIKIGAGGAAAGNAQNVTIGSPSTTTNSRILIQGGNIATSSGVSGITIGSSTTDANLVPFQVDSYSTFADVASSCSTTVNQGSLYYNTASNGIRGCINGSWEDVVSTASLGLQLFGVVPDTGANPGDLASVVSANSTGPCKVSFNNTTTVNISACVAFSGGRKVIVAAQTAVAVGANGTKYVCMQGTDSQPNISTTLPTFSAAAPIACLAEIVVAGGVTADIYDTRTFTTSSKTYATVNSAARTPGMIVVSSTAKLTILNAVVNNTKLRGTIVATDSSAASSNTINAIIATDGPAWIKANAGTANDLVVGTATAGIGATSATLTFGPYAYLGMAQTAFDSTCTTVANCSGSLFTNLNLR